MRSRDLLLGQDNQADWVRGQGGRLTGSPSHPALRIMTRALRPFPLLLLLMQLIVSDFTVKVGFNKKGDHFVTPQTKP